MKLIGITGGVGAGKSQILDYIKNQYNAFVLLADQVANDLKKKGQSCYKPLVELLGEDVLDLEGEIDKAKMAAIIFHNEEKLAKVNELIHPAVRKYIYDQIEEKKASGVYEYFFLEAALLIEEHYDEVVDELWYIYADEATRSHRLKKNRGYDDDRIKAIMEGQLSEAVFREKCDFVIDNSKALEDTYRQIKDRMEAK